MAVASPSRAVDQPSTRPPATCPATIAVRCSSGRRDFLIPQSSLVGYIGLQHVKSDVDDHVFLSADHLAAAELDKDRTGIERSEEHTSELQSLMRISYAVFCLKKKKS